MLKWKTICGKLHLGISITTSCLQKNPQNFAAMASAYMQRRFVHHYIVRGRFADYDISSLAECCFNEPAMDDKLDDICRSKALALRSLHRTEASTGLEDFLQKIDKNVASMVSPRQLKIDLNTMNYVSDFFYSFGGKHFHSTAMLLLAKSLGDVMGSQARFSEVIEMTHCANILHSLVSESEQSSTTLQRVIGNNGIILGGDFMLSKASIMCTEIGSMPLIQLLCIIIQNYTSVNCTQAHFMNVKTNDPLERLKEICRVAFYRSVSMMANGCQGIGLLAGADQAACYEFGKHLGMAVFSISEVVSYMGKSLHSCSLPAAFASKKYDNILELIQANQPHKVQAP
jgi:geranylgeranyl pyrophosphate synthase